MHPTYDERRGAIARRAGRLARAVRWRLKGLLRRPRTLLVELNWRLGDEIMALPVLEALHTRYPDAAIEVISNYPALFEDHPAVRAVNPAHPRPDRYVLLRGASRRMWRLAEYSRKAGIAVPDARPRLHYRDWDSELLARVPRDAAPLVALAPGASWPIKRWPREHWAELASALHRDGLRVIVVGAAGEGLGPGLDLTGQTSVRDAACLLHAADVAVACDSGLLHLALASGTRVVGLFGPTDPEFLVRGDPNLTAIRSGLPCSGFWNHAARAGAGGVCPAGHGSCLEDIAVDRVLEAVRARLAEDAGGV
ncbi:MAG: glycosyltransferase family 9 protein [Candidatus Hydrogenedentes bacterium]|nr:glycosyltransferase family 9 protein [Candidatus Hydrogenedentota bacterium]